MTASRHMWASSSRSGKFCASALVSPMVVDFSASSCDDARGCGDRLRYWRCGVDDDAGFEVFGDRLRVRLRGRGILRYRVCSLVSCSCYELDNESSGQGCSETAAMGRKETEGGNLAEDDEP